MRILFPGDIHCSDFNPRSRKDDYCKAMLLKFEEVVEVANKLKATVVWKGDMFHKKDPTATSHGLVISIMQLLKRYHLDHWLVIGNHDFEGAVDTILRQPIGELLTAEVIKVLPDDLHMTQGTASVWLSGAHFNYRMNSMVDEFNNIPTEALKKMVLEPGLKVRVGHYAPLVPFEKPDWDVIADKANWDVYISGHLHDYIGQKHMVNSRGEKKIWSCVGGLSRGSIKESNLTRTPCMELLTVDESGWKLEEIFLKSVIKAEEVFRILEYKQGKKHDNELAAFAHFVDQRVSGAGFISLDDKINEQLKDVDEDIRELAKQYLGQAEEGLK